MQWDLVPRPLIRNVRHVEGVQNGLSDVYAWTIPRWDLGRARHAGCERWRIDALRPRAVSAELGRGVVYSPAGGFQNKRGPGGKNDWRHVPGGGLRRRDRAGHPHRPVLCRHFPSASCRVGCRDGARRPMDLRDIPGAFSTLDVLPLESCQRLGAAQAGGADHGPCRGRSWCRDDRLSRCQPRLFRLVNIFCGGGRVR